MSSSSKVSSPVTSLVDLAYQPGSVVSRMMLLVMLK